MQAVQALPASSGSSLRPVLSVPRTEARGRAGPPAREAHGVQPNSQPVPSEKGLRNPRKTRPIQRKTRTSNHRIPGSGKAKGVKGPLP